MASLNPDESAKSLREKVWGERPFPVDPVWIARTMGIDVVEVKLEQEIFAGIIKEKGKEPIIALNSGDTKNRKRFSCAHELGHYISHTEKGDNYEYVDLRGVLASKGIDDEEKFANAFAASLLMPEDEVRRLKGENTPPFIMAIHFGVSDDAMNYRLKNLGLSA